MNYLDNIEHLLKETQGATLVLATKTQSKEILEEIHKKYPNLIFGENRVQELLEKYDSTCTWHLIGQLQSNKVKYIIDKVDLIHSLDRESLLKEINLRAKQINKVQKCLIEINMTDDPSRGGIQQTELDSFLQKCEAYTNVQIEGLMTVMPIGLEREEISKRMKSLYEIFKSHNFNILSMGMSEDFKIALENGSTMVRLGRVIFGERK